MESVSSFELKDLFHRCPRLKTKLSGQELRAISEIMTQRVRIQHNQLLAKIHRLEMYRSASEKKILQLNKPGGNFGVVPNRRIKPEKANEQDTISENKGLLLKAWEQRRVSFTLPSLEDNGIVLSQDKNIKHFHNNTSTSCINDSSKNNNEKKEQLDTADMVTFGKDIYEENIAIKDKLIENLTKEIEFIKTLLEEKSDYDRILQESMHQRNLIAQLKLDLGTARKDKINLMKDIERLRYALKFRDHTCQDHRDELSECELQQIGRHGRNKNSKSDGKPERQTTTGAGCCNSVFVSSQYLFIGSGNPTDCPWRKQLASCRSILLKKYRENADLSFMLSQTQERLSKFKVLT